MKVKTIAFLYNVRHIYPDPKKPKTMLEIDFDDPETTKLQLKYLRNAGYNVIAIEANEKAYLKLFRLKKKLIWFSIFPKGCMVKTEKHKFLPCWRCFSYRIPVLHR